MARRQTEFTLPLSLHESFQQLRGAVDQQRWIVLAADPPRSGPRAELSFKAGPSQVSGCGKTRVKLRQLNPSGTHVTLGTTRAFSDKRAEAPALSVAGELKLDPRQLGLDPDAPLVPGRVERNLVRFLVAIAMIVAVLALILVPIPQDAEGIPSLPAVALDQTWLYRLEVALLVFYGSLLLLTPAFSGLVRGRLPTEISARGAKFADEVDQSAEVTQRAITKVEQSANVLAEEMALADVDIKQLKKDVTKLKE